ncbi:MAG TPA: phage head-tail connector protein [Bacteroidales bacterium]|nr:phage head-tail connector protein [Bacteroidales bacterium]HOG56597.1 phage head-tail connector protein [Bacteroidales bacterium]
MKRYKLKEKISNDLISLDELKDNLRITHNNADTQLNNILKSAIEEVENECGRVISLSSYLLYMDNWPISNEIEIEKGPVSGITCVRYWSGGSFKTMPADNYQLDNTELTARVRFFDFPAVDSGRMNNIEIEFTTGWGAQADIPGNIRDAVLLLGSERYLTPANRNIKGEMTTAGNILRKLRVQRY